MKILIIRNYPSYLSVKNNTYNIQEIGLAKSLIRIGQVCDIVFWTDKEEEQIKYSFDGDLCFNIFYRRGKTILKNAILHIDDLIQDYDVIQPCEYNQIQSWILAKKYACKTIIYHGPYYSDFNKKYNLMCSLFDLIFLDRYRKLNTPFLVKSNMAKIFLEGKGLGNVKNVGVGIDLQVLDNIENNCDEPIYNSIKNYPGIKLLYIGRLEPRRNIKFLFRILERVKKHATVKLFIIGNGNEKYVKELFSYAKNLNIIDHIEWQKNMKQKYMSDVYRFADYFLLPTYYEIFGMVLLEAMFFGKVVLTTENGGSSTLIKNKQNGYILSQNDVDEWTETILEVEKKPQIKIEIGKQANSTVVNYYTWDKLAIKFIEEYKKVGI